MLKNKLLTALLAICVVVFVITFSIGLPIYFRPFYYMQIDSLDLEERTGYTKAEIKEGYDEILDFLTLPGAEYGTGVFASSSEGEGHFRDCKGLFTLNLVLLLASLAGTITLILLNILKKFKLSRPFGFNFLFTCGVGTLAFFAVLGGLCAISFDRAFEIFHKIFFPGKDNWMFNPYEDEIILAMPQEFFMNCAILIAGSIILISIGFIAYGIIEKRKRKEK